MPKLQYINNNGKKERRQTKGKEEGPGQEGGGAGHREDRIAGLTHKLDSSNQWPLSSSPVLGM